jgi:transcriptional regulator with XRE-family HTH domain
VADFYEQLGARIARLRHGRDTTQEGLAEAAEIAASYVAHIETGSKRPTLDVLLRIAAGLEVPLWRLLADERLSLDERVWVDATKRLGDAARGLQAADIDLLVALAHRLAPPAKDARLERRSKRVKGKRRAPRPR